MKYSGIAVVVVVVGMLLSKQSVVQATPSYYALFRRVEKPKPRTELFRARCQTCHVKPAGGKGLNPYGTDYRTHGADEDALRAIRTLDSDGDGSKNEREISGGFLPGDPKSKPAE